VKDKYIYCKNHQQEKRCIYSLANSLLNRGSQLWLILAFGNVYRHFGCQNWGSSIDNWWVKARDTALHRTIPPKKYLAQNVEVENAKCVSQLSDTVTNT
jgi:hypothetical protein